MHIRKNRQRVERITRFLLLFLCVCGLVGGCAAAAALWQSAAAIDLGAPAADLNPLEAAALRAYLSFRAADLTAPAGADPAPVSFSVQSGETAVEVAERLAAQNLVRDAQVLNYYLRYKGYDGSIEAGDFVLYRTMTIPEIAVALTDARARDVSVRLWEGWRMEQMAAALSAQANLAVSSEAFMALAGPNGQRLAGYAFLNDVPPGASLEGFLFPDTYSFSPGATAAEAVNKMLRNFEGHLPADYRAAVAARNLTLYQAVIIASLIEREGMVDDERPIIASVIFNRLAVGQALEIDATVQYAVATSENWWPPVAGLDFRSIASPYNTYYVSGLPAGPIANPGLSSLLAVAHPVQTSYLYYRALCDGSHRHVFAVTYAEHVQNACP